MNIDNRDKEIIPIEGITLTSTNLVGKHGSIRETKIRDGIQIYWIVLDDGYCSWYTEDQFSRDSDIEDKPYKGPLDEDGLIEYAASQHQGPDYGSYWR